MGIRGLYGSMPGRDFLGRAQMCEHGWVVGRVMTMMGNSRLLTLRREFSLLARVRHL